MRRHDLSPQLASGITVDGAVDPGHEACARLLGPGWFPPETAADGMTYAWTAADTAWLTLPSRRALPGRLVVTAYGLNDGKGPRWMDVLVNGRALGRERLPVDLSTIDYAITPGIMKCGDNEVALVVDRRVRPADALGSPDARLLGALVDCVRYLPAGEPGQASAADPYDQAGALLDRDRSLELRPARLGGARLHLGWRGTAGDDSVVAEVTVARCAPTLFRMGWPAVVGDGADRDVRVELPAGLPPKALLSLRLVRRDGDAGGRVTVSTLALERVGRPVDVVLIIVDTLRPDHLGCYGDRRGLSPAIDALAHDGILFENAIAPSPITAPSHASLFTSRWAGETGVLINCASGPSPALPLLAEMLRDLDYDTRGVVSISAVAGAYGFGRGFAAFADDLDPGYLAPADTVVARLRRELPHATHPLFLWAHFADPHEPYDAHGLVRRSTELHLAGRLVASVPTTTYTPTELELDLPPYPTDLLFTSASAFQVRSLDVAGLDGPPPLLDPHEPPSKPVHAYRAGIGAAGARRVRVTFALSDLIATRGGLHERYAREVAAADSGVGNLLGELRRRGLYDESLIVFAADHGEALGERDLIGHVENLTDVLLRVPLIIKPPRSAGLRPGQRRRDLASLVDVLPTVLAQLGRPPLAGARGRDLLAGDGRRGGDDAVFSETHQPQAQHTLFALRGERYKIVFDPAGPAWEFYDLKRDRREERNLYRPGDAKARRWQARLEAQIAGIGLSAAADETSRVDARGRRALRALGY